MSNYDKYLQTLSDESSNIWKHVINDVLNQSPEIVGFSVNQASLKSSLILAKLIKKEDDNVKVVFGGPQVTVNPIHYPNVDCVICGEGEKALLKYTKDTSQKLIGYPLIKDLNELPNPDRENLFFKGPYVEYGHIITGRGCPFSCIFCASKNIWKGVCRYRSVDNVVSEMEEVENNYGSNEFFFRDDTFTLHKERVLNLCDKIKDKDYKWQCDTRVDNLDRNVLEAMKDSGCYKIRIGVESGSDRILEFTQKRITKDRVREVVRNAKDIGLQVETYFLVGLPTETRDELKETLHFAEELDPDSISISIATPYYGTVLKDIMPYDKGRLEMYFHQSPELLYKLKDRDLIEEIYDLADKKKKKQKEL
jgi:radical SAM superfamily enzyme YgiQ (UPF0313 family)